MPRAGIYTAGGTFSQVGPEWPEATCWAGDWMALGETAIMLAGKM